MKRTAIKRTPMKRRAPRRRADADLRYLDWIRQQPCLICAGGNQRTATEAAHVGERGLGQKCPDRETVPLCAAHHRTGKEAHHVLGKKFWEYHGLRRDVMLNFYSALYESEGRR